MAGTIESAYSGTQVPAGIVAEKDALGVLIAVLDGAEPIDAATAGEKKLALANMAARYPNEHGRADYIAGIDAEFSVFKSLYSLEGVSISNYDEFLKTERGRKINKEVFPLSFESDALGGKTLSTNQLDAYMGSSAPIIVILMKSKKPNVQLAIEQLTQDLPLIEPSAFGKIIYDI